MDLGETDYYLEVGCKRYKPLQVHIHFDRSGGSEHGVNGRKYPAEVCIILILIFSYISGEISVNLRKNVGPVSGFYIHNTKYISNFTFLINKFLGELTKKLRNVGLCFEHFPGGHLAYI